MSNKPTLLPPNATELERTLEQVTARIDDIPIPIKPLWNPANCPTSHLPWLAWAVSVDEWETQWPEKVKRDVVTQAIKIHRHKGTPGAIKQALQALGYRDVAIIEPQYPQYNGKHKYDGSITYGTDMHWAEFDVHLNAGEHPAPELAIKIRKSIENYKPKRSTLRHLKYGQRFYNGNHRYDGSITYDGGYVND